MKGYSEKETKDLLAAVGEAVRAGQCLTKVFEDFAAKTGRAKGSVRNYYYKFVKTVGADEKLIEKYPIAREMTVGKNVAFTKEEEEYIFDRITEQVNAGKSVRKSVYFLADGDEKLALRYQNKYRNMKKLRSLDLDEDGTYKLLSEKINSLVERIGRNLRSENERLKKTVGFLREENRRLKAKISQSSVKEFFADGDVKDEKNA